MRISVGSDHRGFQVKSRLVDSLRQAGHQVLDEGTYDSDSCDYPDIAAKVARRVSSGESERGVLVCGTGIGMQITANKIAGVRATVCHDEKEAALSRRHNDTNVLCLPGHMTDAGRTDSLVNLWLTTEFEGGRHARRIEKIQRLEQGARQPGSGAALETPVASAPPALQSLIATGTKLWLDSIDPRLVRTNRSWGATGATSNPIIVADLLKTGRFDGELRQLVSSGLDDDSIAWEMTDRLVRQAQEVFLPVWQATGGNDGYVSFELDPLLEDPRLGPPLAERTARYVELGKRWSKGHSNRMIKVPATPAGLAALEELVAAGVTLNVTLIFTLRQYREARDAIWRGAQRRPGLEGFKSVYSIFVSRVDVYTEKHVPQLSPAAQGQVGIVNAKRIWLDNRDFWRTRRTPCQQEIIFASTGVKKESDPPEKYVAAFAGSDIQTNPPATNDAIARSGITFSPQVSQLPPQTVLAEIDRLVDVARLESVLMDEGVKKFAEPHQALLKLISAARRQFAA